jgi:hypothetical protein
MVLLVVISDFARALMYIRGDMSARAQTQHVVLESHAEHIGRKTRETYSEWNGFTPCNDRILEHVSWC